MSHKLRLVGSTGISTRLRIYGFLLLSSNEPESKYDFGSNSAKSMWMVYALTPGEGRILVGVFDDYLAAWELFNRLANEFKFLDLGRVAVAANEVLLVHPVYSKQGAGKVQIEFVVCSGDTKYAILTPGPLEFADASKEINVALEQIERAKKREPALLRTLVEDAVPASALAASAAADSSL